MGRRFRFAGALFATLAFILAFTPDCARGNGEGVGGSSSAPASQELRCVSDDQCTADDPCSGGKCIKTHCVFAPLPDGPAPGQPDLPNDCVDYRCAGGHLATVPNDSEVPDDDATGCSQVVCKGGKPTPTPYPAGTRCPAGECNDAGQCFGCVTPDDCGVEDTFCRSATCVDSICGLSKAPAGTLLPDTEQKVGDCKRVVCDGNGGVTIQNDDTDGIADGDPCTEDRCSHGVPKNPLAEAGTDCGDGKVCDDQGECVECVDDSQCKAPDTCGAVSPHRCGCAPETRDKTCFGHCGKVTGNCGQSVDCADNCQAPTHCHEGLCCLSQPKNVSCDGVACGSVLDNCGQTVDCPGSCAPPDTCGGGGTPNVCGCTDDGKACDGKECGTVTNNCGSTLTCTPNSCAAPKTCGGGGTPNVCGCTDDGSACQGKECGLVLDNCGEMVPCAPNDCPAPTTCGGGGVPNMCGCTDDGKACDGKECGTTKNNCGQTVTCRPNACPAGTLCGVGTPNMCG